MSDYYLLADNTLKDVLARFPNGFAVSPKGDIYEVVMLTQDRSQLPTPETSEQGFLFVKKPLKLAGDERFIGVSPKDIEDMTLDDVEDDLEDLMEEQSAASDTAAYELYESYFTEEEEDGD